jgi:hypothetical protein
MVFAWHDANDVRRQAVGLTRDISVRGAFAFTVSPPPLDTIVKFECFFPPVRGASQSVRMYGQGQVVRVGARDGETSGGFAIASKRLVLQRGEE